MKALKNAFSAVLGGIGVIAVAAYVSNAPSIMGGIVSNLAYLAMALGVIALAILPAKFFCRVIGLRHVVWEIVVAVIWISGLVLAQVSNGTSLSLEAVIESLKLSLIFSAGAALLLLLLSKENAVIQHEITKKEVPQAAPAHC